MRRWPVVLGVLMGCWAGHAAAQYGGAWTDLGPGPATGGQTEGIPNNEVVGAVNAIAAHPTDANILYIGAVNGGIWRTNNALAAAPSWTRQTDALNSLSIGAIEFDPTDANRQTLVAGVARRSSYSSVGGAQIGMLRTTDGGSNWTVLAGAGNVLANRNVLGVAARGSLLLAATTSGLYRSTDTGANFTLISGGAGSGLPAGSTPDLVGVPGNNSRFYLVVRTGTTPGLYRSDDQGATWTHVSNEAAVNTAFVGAVWAEVSVGNSGQVYIGIVDGNGRLANVFRSPNGDAPWTALGVPTTTENDGFVFGIHPGGQGGIHFSMAADPNNANVVYVGGDRQPAANEGGPGGVPFPNSIGANNYSGRLFRHDGTSWSPLTHNGTSNNSSPHADSRDMVFDAQNNLLQSDDGGIYKRTAPNGTTGLWLSLNGTLQSTEYHGIVYDTVSNRVLGGTQDNGSNEQINTTRTFRTVQGGDGNDPAVDDVGSATQSVRYTAFQFFQVPVRRVVNASNTVTATTFPQFTASPTISGQFYTPVAANEVVAARVVVGADNGVYESLDEGATATRISTLRINSFVGDPLVYGVPGNPDFLLFGNASGVHLRAAAGGAINLQSNLPAAVVDLSVDPDAPARIFGMTASTVHFSTNSGSNFTDITGNLITGFSPGTLRSMVFIPTANSDAVVVGADRGTFIAFETPAPAFSTWQRLGTQLPNAPVYELDYDRPDQVLIAGTLGRGAWQLSPVIFQDNVFANGFE